MYTSKDKELWLSVYKTSCALPWTLGICGSYWISGDFSLSFYWKLLAGKGGDRFLITLYLFNKHMLSHYWLNGKKYIFTAALGMFISGQ